MKFNPFYLSMCAIVLGAIVHISIVLLVPLFGKKDAARIVMERSSEGSFRTIDAQGQPILANADPFFKVASCRFDLEKSGVLISGGETDIFWSASVFNDRGRVIYSLNKRSAIGNQLRMIVVSPVQMARIRQFQPEDVETSIVVETSESNGFVLIRALQRDASMTEGIENFMGNLGCDNYS